LKLIGGDRLSNTEEKVRLQLYYYPKWNVNKWISDRSAPLVFQAFKAKRTKYPSSIYITVKGIPRVEEAFVKTRSRLPTEIEVGKVTLEQVFF
jgi:hypothetical protein